MKLDFINTTFWIVFVPLALMVALFLRRIIMNWFWIPYTRKKAELAALEQRRQGNQVRVRQTDIEEHLTRDDEAKRRYAEDLIKKGDFVQAANILESIKFQRRAIDILEKNGYIHEAAAILLRLGVPHRAGVVYERSGWYEQAAEHFLVAGKHEMAGDAFSKLGKESYEYYNKAADCFETAGKTDKMLKCLAAILKTDKVVHHCMKEKSYAFLSEYLTDPLNALHAFKRMSDDEMKELVGGCALEPKTAQLFANWVNLLAIPSLNANVLQRVIADSRVNDHFWRTMAPKVRKRTVGVIVNQKDAAGVGFVTKHAESLRRTGDFLNATELYRVISDYQGMGLTLVDSGQLPILVQWLKSMKRDDLGAKIENAMGGDIAGPWHGDVIAQARAYVMQLPASPHRRPDQLTGEMPDDVPEFNLEDAG